MKINKIIKKKPTLVKLSSVLVMVMCLMIVRGVPVFAAQCGGADTVLINCDNNEGGVWHILNLLIEILSIGVGILGVIGISVAGVQVLTAKDSPEQVKKAKNRLGQIVIGLALYAVLFVVIEWLLPGGLLNSQSALQNIGSTTQVEEIRKRQEEARKKAEQDNVKKSSGYGDPGGSGGSINQQSKAE